MTNGASDLLLTLPQLQLAPRSLMFPPKGFLLYSHSGIGKSTMASTFPTPRLTQLWDANDKDMPYWYRVKAQGGAVYPPLTEEAVQFDLSAKQDGSLIIPVRYGLDKKGRVIQQIEYYSEPDPEHPTAWIKWKARMTNFFKESLSWGTFITDSTTEQVICYRNLCQYVTHPASSNYDQRHWFGQATDEMERVWTQRFPAYKCNRVLCMHIKRMVVEKDSKGNSTGQSGKEEFEGQMIRKLAAPGRLSDADGVQSQYSEVYRIYLGKDLDSTTGERVRLVQTRKRSTEGYHGSTQIKAPDPSIPEYMALWSNYTSL
jgi:hypothetical protein